MEPEMGELVVKCISKADIFVNGVKMEKGKKGKQRTKQLPGCQYIVEARANGYLSMLKKVHVYAGRSAVVDFTAMQSEKELREKGVTAKDGATLLRDSLMQLREQAKAQEAAAWVEYTQKVEALKKEYTYDVITMNDGSTILCKINDIGERLILFRQKGTEDLQSVSVRLVESVRYGNGEYKTFKKR